MPWVLCCDDDESIDFDKVQGFVSGRVEQHPSVAAVYRQFLHSLDQSAKSKFAAEEFRGLDIARRGKVIQSVVPSYVSVRNQPIWRQRTQLTSQNLELLLGNDQAKRIRQFIIRDLLSFYYQGKSGWQAVGYDLFPGFVPNETVTVTATRARGSRIRFELSDETFETPRRHDSIASCADFPAYRQRKQTRSTCPVHPHQR